MVNVTIRTDSNEKEDVRTLMPCEAVFVTQILKAGEDSYAVNSVSAGVLDMEDIGKGAVAMANSAVSMLICLADGSRKREAAILHTYMEAFVNLAADKTGTETMNKVSEMILKED